MMTVPALGQLLLNNLSAMGLNSFMCECLALVLYAFCLVLMAGSIANTLLTNGSREISRGGRTIPPSNRTFKLFVTTWVFVMLSTVLYFTFPFVALIFFFIVCAGVAATFAAEGPADRGY
jgi:hypothetical protein